MLRIEFFPRFLRILPGFYLVEVSGISDCDPPDISIRDIPRVHTINFHGFPLGVPFGICPIATPGVPAGVFKDFSSIYVLR